MNQIEWEQQYRDKVIEARTAALSAQRGRGYMTDSSTGQSIITQYLDDCAVAIEKMVNRKTRGVGGKYNQAVKEASTFLTRERKQVEDYRKVSYIALSVMLDCLFHEKPKHSKVSYIAIGIGKALEEEQQIDYFKKVQEGTDYLQAQELKEFKGQRRKRIQKSKKSLAKHNNEWQGWGTKIRLHVGIKILKELTSVMSEYVEQKTVRTGGHAESYLGIKKSLYDFVDEHCAYILSRTNPTAPCIEPPLDWDNAHESYITGGFHSMECSNTTPFIRTKNRDQRTFVLGHPCHLHVSACNTLQGTEWAINKPVLDFIELAVRQGMFPDQIPSLDPRMYSERPPKDHPMYKQWGQEAHEIYKWNRKNTTNLLRFRKVFELAKFFEDRPFWFVHNTDYRGRIYSCSSHLNPQGPEYVRGMLQFSKGMELGPSGYKWLGVHGANCYGRTEVSYNDRFRWVMDNLEGIRQVASSPDSSAGRELLNGASKPIHFYAFCREWAAIHQSRKPEAFVSYLPVTFDGSCNGLQHYSALLCDRDGARRVNLSHTELPESLYRDVAAKLKGVLTSSFRDKVGEDILKSIDKDTVKTVVMTIPYGITKRGVSLHLKESLGTDDWEIIILITEELSKILDKMIAKPLKLQEWLRDVSYMFSSREKQMKWISPVGFPVMQPYIAYNESSIKTEFFGKKVIKYKDKPLGVNRKDAAAGLAPNLIHSLDASHLVMAINKAKASGIDDLIAIHDSLGSHAGHAHRLRHCLNDTFCELYTPDVLAGIRNQWNADVQLPGLPAYGNYEITEVLDAPYFFG